MNFCDILSEKPRYVFLTAKLYKLYKWDFGGGEFHDKKIIIDSDLT